MVIKDWGLWLRDPGQSPAMAVISDLVVSGHSSLPGLCGMGLKMRHYGSKCVCSCTPHMQSNISPIYLIPDSLFSCSTSMASKLRLFTTMAWLPSALIVILFRYPRSIKLSSNFTFQVRLVWFLILWQDWDLAWILPKVLNIFRTFVLSVKPLFTITSARNPPMLHTTSLKKNGNADQTPFWKQNY